MKQKAYNFETKRKWVNPHHALHFSFDFDITHNFKNLKD